MNSLAGLVLISSREYYFYRRRCCLLFPRLEHNFNVLITRLFVYGVQVEGGRYWQIRERKNNKNARSCCIEWTDKFLHILLDTHTQIPLIVLAWMCSWSFSSDARHNSFSPTVLITIFTHIFPLGSSMSCRSKAREGLIANIVDGLIRSGTSCTIKSRLVELATQSSTVAAHNEKRASSKHRVLFS